MCSGSPLPLQEHLPRGEVCSGVSVAAVAMVIDCWVATQSLVAVVGLRGEHLEVAVRLRNLPGIPLSAHGGRQEEVTQRK